MAARSDKKKYQRHVYSGPRKSRKRVLGGLRKYTNLTSRKAYWRQQENSNIEHIGVDNDPNASISNIPIESYNPDELTSIEAPSIPDISQTEFDVAVADDSMEVESNVAVNSMKVECDVAVADDPVKLEPDVDDDDPMIYAYDVDASDDPLQINLPKPEPYIDSIEINVEASNSTDNGLSGISGYRIVELRHVIEWSIKMERHRSECESSQIEFVSETRNGFQSNLMFKCSMCDKTWQHCTENTDKVNTSFVWGTVTAGSHYTQAAQITKFMDIPTMSAVTFRQTENKLSKVWCEHLTKEIKKAGEEERSIAIEKGQVSTDGIPFITVHVDGGWLKKSYGHNFDLSSGMACIIGKETKKCVYLGVQNKYCYTCHYYDKKNMASKPHDCWKNYSGPSTAMESQILVEGFQKSIEMHQMRYLKVIGDGDSSVISKLKDKVAYGNLIKKIESKNHVIKNYTKALYKILADTKLSRYGRNILKPKLMKLTLVARKIIMHYNGKSASLVADLRNGPLHVFGDHDNCKDYYCNFKRISNMSTQNMQEKQNILEKLKMSAPEVWALINVANENIVMKAGRLSNETTNVAENFMSVINKYNSGKRISLGKGGSYQRQIYGAGIYNAAKHKWHAKARKRQTSKRPGLHLKKKNQRKENSKQRLPSMTQKRLLKEKHQPDKDYVPNASDPININLVELEKQCEAKLVEFQKSPQEITSIEIETIGQQDNDLYNTYRSDRLTASKFGMVCKRRNNTPCHNHVHEILYKNHKKDTLYWQHNENVARNMYMQQYGKTVRPSGIFIDKEFGFLAASSDGIIEEEKAVIEIKCFPIVKKSQTLEMLARKNKFFPLILHNNTTFVMNKKHDYYFEIQGLLRVSEMQKCYVICFTTATQPLIVIEVYRDEEFISDMMPKLIQFFKTCVLPEIVLRRVPKNLKCVDMNELTRESRNEHETRNCF